MKRVASATERDMIELEAVGLWGGAWGALLLRDVRDANVNVERFLAGRNWMSLRDDEVDFLFLFYIAA